MLLPPIVPLNVIVKWLPEIFPEGTPNRNYVIREMAAKTLFVMLYAGAVEGADRWLRPNQVTRMTDAQSRKTDASERIRWARESLRQGKSSNIPGRWYAVDTREPIRDETLRAGLVAVGAVVELGGLATTSAKPRYALSKSFAALLADLHGNSHAGSAEVMHWQRDHLSAAALGRVRLLRGAVVRSTGHKREQVMFPNGETRLMHPGPSTVITKAVVEVFAVRFLREPGVVFLSESGNKVVARDNALASAIGLKLDYARNLPDIVLADVAASAPRVVFVEVVATDGAVTEQRRKALLDVAAGAGYTAGHVSFVSAFLDRKSPAFRKLASEIAWDTFAWFVSEPDKLVIFGGEGMRELPSLSGAQR